MTTAVPEATISVIDSRAPDIGLRHVGRSGLADLGGVETHTDDGVPTHEAGALHHAVDRLTTAVLQQLRVLGDLSAP